MKSKKNLILIAFGSIVLIVVTLGATYAYFMAQGGGNANIDTNVITSTTDNLAFSFGEEIYISANENNFASGMGDLSDNTTGTAILTANNYTNTATETYNIYLIIEANDFEYTTDNQTPELLLNVTDPNGNKVENITGLVHYDDGFDITTRTGGFLLVPDYEITANNTPTIQDWNIEVTFVNLDSDQVGNTNKTLTGKLYLTQDKMSSYELIQISNVESTTTYKSIEVTPELTNGSADVEKYYFGIEEANATMAYASNNSLQKLSNTLASVDDIEFVESESPNYEFNNLKANTEYTIYSYVEDENKIKSNIYTTNITTDEYEVPKIDEVTYSVTLNSITVNVSATGGSNNITKYMYKIDDGEWIESDSSSYTFDGLSDTTEYEVRIKVGDSDGYESTEYYKAITTEVYILPVVANVNATTTWNSITLTPTGTNGTNEIVGYEYSINNGAYQTSNVFNNLSDNTSYTINVRAIDSAGRKSNVYSTSITTNTYRLPTISVTTSSTSNAITVNVSATPGDGSIVSYHYSRDNGSNYTQSTNNSYTFSGLTSNTTYYLKVYVTDSNGKTSTVYAGSKATAYVNPSLTNLTTSSITSNSITLRATASAGSNSISRYYYSKDNGSSWVSSTSSSYTFTGLSSNTTYTFKAYVTDSAGRSSSQKSVSAKTSGVALATYIKNLYTSDGTNGLYYHNGSGSYTNAGYEARDNSYRYAGANPNNYLCFGSTASSCPSNNLYRIIGVFGNYVKIIKNASYGTYYWDGDGDRYATNDWSASTVNTSTLNTTFYNSLGSTWRSKIVNYSWKVGGMDISYGFDSDAKLAFDYEVGNYSLSITYTARIGLMYLSDYYYASSPTNWHNIGGGTTSNWLHLRTDEWTITPWYGESDMVYKVSDDSTPLAANIRTNDAAIRPVMYLSTAAVYSSGTGTSSNPYRIS